MPAEDFPQMQDDPQFGPSFAVPQRILKTLMSQVAFSMAHKDVRHYLNGLLFVVEGKKISLVATNGFRLAFASASLDVEVPKQQVILPRKTVLELQRLLSDKDGDIQMQFASNQARFVIDSITFVSKLVDGKFPDYTRVIPKNHKNSVILGRVPLLATLRRIASLKVIDELKGVRLSLTSGLLRLVSYNAKPEEAVDELDIDYGGDTIDIGFIVKRLNNETVTFA